MPTEIFVFPFHHNTQPCNRVKLGFVCVNYCTAGIAMAVLLIFIFQKPWALKTQQLFLWGNFSNTVGQVVGNLPAGLAWQAAAVATQKHRQSGIIRVRSPLDLRDTAIVLKELSNTVLNCSSAALKYNTQRQEYHTHIVKMAAVIGE